MTEMSAPEAPALLDPEEVAESLTGWEEIAVAKVFGKDLADLEGTSGIRALAFVVTKRERECDDRTAYEAVMGMTLKAVMGRFDTEPEPMPDDPATPAGKGD